MGDVFWCAIGEGPGNWVEERGEESEGVVCALTGDTNGPILEGLKEKLLAGEKRDSVLEGGGGGGGGDAGGVERIRELVLAFVALMGGADIDMIGTGDTEEEDVAEALEEATLAFRTPPPKLPASEWNIVGPDSGTESSGPACWWGARGDSIIVDISLSLSDAAMLGRLMGKNAGEPTTGEMLLHEGSSSTK